MKGLHVKMSLFQKAQHEKYTFPGSWFTSKEFFWILALVERF